MPPTGSGNPPWRPPLSARLPWIPLPAAAVDAPQLHPLHRKTPRCWREPVGRTGDAPSACWRWSDHPEASAEQPPGPPGKAADSPAIARAPEDPQGAPATARAARSACHPPGQWPAPRQPRHRDAARAPRVPATPDPPRRPADPSVGSAASVRPRDQPSPQTTSAPGTPTAGTRMPSCRLREPGPDRDQAQPPGHPLPPSPNSCR